MVGQTPKDTPFGLDANVAAGLAYLFTLLGGLIMLFGGGTNKFVKWAAAQSIVTFVAFMVLIWVGSFLGIMIHFYFLGSLIDLVYLVVWLYTSIFAFQGKEVKLPVIGDLTKTIFASMLA